MDIETVFEMRKLYEESLGWWMKEAEKARTNWEKAEYHVNHCRECLEIIEKILEEKNDTE